MKKPELDIEILGSGCLSCNKLVEIAHDALKRTGLDNVSRVTKVEDLQRMMELGVMSTPALVINDRLISSGKVYKVDELGKIFLAEVSK